MSKDSLQSIGFGGGCHWCTEAVFQSLRAVHSVGQGFIRSDTPHESWSEAVEVTFEPDKITLEDLLAVHLATHASTSEHKMRGKYRSAAYTFDPDQHAAIQSELERLSAETDTPFVTHVLMHRGFKPSDDRFHNYYATDPDRPFCQAYIDPKLAKLRARFSQLLRP